MKIKRLLLLAVAGTGLLFGQGVSILPWPVTDVSPELKQYLNLTDAQASALRDVRKSKQDAESALYEQAAQKQATLEKLLSSGSTDYGQIGQLTVEIRDIYKKLPISGEPYRTRALSVLNQEQRNKLPGLTTALQLQAPAYDATTFDLIDYPTPRAIPVDFGGGAGGAGAAAGVAVP